MNYMMRRSLLYSRLTAITLCAGFCIIVAAYFAPAPATAATSVNTPSPLPRDIVTLYNSKTQNKKFTNTHMYLDMPANYLGYRVIYADINDPLPKLTDSVRAIVLWLNDGEIIPNTRQYLNWLEDAFSNGKKVILIGEIGVPDSYSSTAEGFAHLNRIMSNLGVVDQNRWVNLTYNAEITHKDNLMVGFERDYGVPLPAYRHMRAIPGVGVSHLQVTSPLHPNEPADLVVTSPHGGYVSSGYAMYHLLKRHPDNERDDEAIKFQQWYINPFHFLRTILGDENLPKPDLTTLYGRRIFYSHMDGDGWNNFTSVEKYHNKQVTAAEVIYREIYSRFRDMPFSVGIIVSDLITECFGFPESETIARKILSLPNVEPSSHTYSHPFYWRFFERYQPEDEISLLKYHPPRPTYNIRLLDSLMRKRNKTAWEKYGVDFDEIAVSEDYMEDYPWELAKAKGIDIKVMSDYQGRPRSYACAPFDINQEIRGAAEFINSLAPKGKKVKLVQWSGDTSPYEEALRVTRENGLFNINGGDSRFDDEYPSYASVAPFGVKVGNEWQIYSSNSNENTYTNLWTDRFFGFRYLRTTVNNTETPWRIAPFNVYFHTYSGEREASLNALVENLNFAKSKEIIPIFTSQYAAIASGFFSTEIVEIGNNRWQIKNRGALQTIRFDNATLKSVDFDNSEGVIGQRYYQGSLYVTLNPQVKYPVIALKQHNHPGYYPDSSIPYLISSRWQIIDLQNSKGSLIIAAQGFGAGEMLWKMPKSGSYVATVSSKGTVLYEEDVLTDDNGLLALLLDTDAVSPVTITIGN